MNENFMERSQIAKILADRWLAYMPNYPAWSPHATKAVEVSECALVLGVYGEFNALVKIGVDRDKALRDQKLQPPLNLEERLKEMSKK